MSVIVEAILISFGMLFVFGVSFFAIFLLAITMAPVERSLSKVIWDSMSPKRPLPPPPKGSFRDFSKKH